MAQFVPESLPRFDQSLLSYLNKSFEKLRTAIRELDANVSTAPAAAEVLAGETLVAGATYRDLTTPGPSVEVKTGARAIVLLQAQIGPSTADTRIGFEVSGASTIGVDDKNLSYWTFSGNQTAPGICYITNLTPGKNTFTTKYWSNGGSTTFARRRIIVIPIK